MRRAIASDELESFKNECEFVVRSTQQTSRCRERNVHKRRSPTRAARAPSATGRTDDPFEIGDEMQLALALVAGSPQQLALLVLAHLLAALLDDAAHGGTSQQGAATNSHSRR